jgi:hypothetical protein
MTSSSSRRSSKKKKILVITHNKAREAAESLKLGLEQRQDCSDLSIDVWVSKPQTLLEELIINKGKSGWEDYRMFIIDEAIEPQTFPISYQLEKHFPSAHLVLWIVGEKPKTPDDMKSHTLHYYYKPGMTWEQIIAEYKKVRPVSDAEWDKKMQEPPREPKWDSKTGMGLTANFSYEAIQFQRAINVKRLQYHRNYIRYYHGDKRQYGRVESKIKQILMTGVYDHKLATQYLPPEEQRKRKNKKAMECIRQSLSRWDDTGETVSKNLSRPSPYPYSLSSIVDYWKDITDKDDIKWIADRLRAYEKSLQEKLTVQQKLIARWEDTHPEIAKDPQAFEVGESKK